MSQPYLPLDVAKGVLADAMRRLAGLDLSDVRWYIYRVAVA